MTSNLRFIAGLLAATLLMGCASKTDPNAPSRFNSFQEETARASARRVESVQRVDNVQVARSNLALASQYFAYGRYSTALEVINRSLEVDSANPQAWSLAGAIHFELKDVPAARSAYEKSLAMGPTDPDVLHNYATFLCRNGSEAEGIGYFNRALAIPTYQRPASSASGAGSCLMKLGRDDEARARFAQALREDPSNASALLGSVELAIKRSDAVRAGDLLSKYQQVAPVTAGSLWLAVQVSRLSGNRSEERMAAQDLRNNYPESQELRMLNGLQPTN